MGTRRVSSAKKKLTCNFYAVTDGSFMETSGNPCLQGTDGFQVWHISSGCKVTSNLEHPLSWS